MLRQLQESFQQFRDLYDFAPVGYLTIDRDAFIRQANLKLATMLGIELRQLLGQSLLRFIVGTTQETLYAAQRAAYGAAWSGELVLRKADGGELPVSVEMVGAADPGGRASWRCAVTDITTRHTAERALRASEERYRGLAEQVSDGIFVSDSHGRYVDANDAGCKMLGYTLEELKALTIRDIVSPEEFARLPEQMRRLGSGEIIRNEWRLKRKDGSTFEGELVGRQLPDGRLQGVVRDLTAQKRSEDALLRRLKFERFLFELSQTFIGLPEAEVDANMERGLARVGEFLEMDRVTLFELSRDRTEMTVPYSWNAAGISTPAPVISQRAQPWWVSRVLRGLVSLASTLDDLPEEAAAEKEYLRERGVASAASIPLMVGGEIAGAIAFVSMHRHVTWTDELVKQLRFIGDVLWNALKRREAMQALLAAQLVVRESEERFRLAMSNVAAGVYTLDLNGLVTYVNPAAEAMFGWTNAELLGKKMHDVVHYKHPDGTPYPVEECVGLHILQTGIELREHEDTFIRKDGRFFPVVFSASPLKKDGTTVGIVVGFRDDTLRQDAERALRESEALRASEDRYRGLAEQVVDGIIITDPQGRPLDANRAACDMLGYTLDELTTRGPEDLLATEEIPRVQDMFRRRPSGNIVREEFRLRRKNGSVFTAEIAGRRLRDGRLQAVVRDVTERTETENVQRRLHHLAMLPLEAKVEDVLLEIVDTAIDVAHADFGNIQLLDPKTSTLRIAAQRGFAQAWIDYWNTVTEGKGTCGTTLNRRKRVVVEDVEQSSIFSSADLDMQRKAGVRAVQSTPLVSRSGELIGVLSTHVKRPGRPNEHTLLLLDLLAREAADIIKYARSEKELIRQAALLDLANSCICVRDREETITYWNGGAARCYGWSKAEALGKVSHLLLQTQFPEPLERIVEATRRTGYWEGELAQTCRNGRQITVHSRWAILRDVEGEGFGILEVNDDITARKQAETALRESEQQLQSYIDQAGDGIYVLDGDTGRILNANTRAIQMTGYTREELLRLAAADIESDHDQLFIADSFERARNGVVVVEGRHRRKDGSTFPVEINITSLAPTPPHRILAIVRDASERKRQEQERADESRRKDEFLAFLGHELRNPLAAIHTAIQVISSGGSPKQREKMEEIISRQTALMRRLVDDLLEHERITHGHIELKLSRVDLAECLQRAAAAVQSTVDGRSQTLVLRLPSEPVQFMADGARLEQILGNLLTNASKYSRSGGTIELSGDRAGDFVVIRCADNGQGVPAEYQKKIFEPFARGLKTELGYGEASVGLGLALVKQLTELHGGTVSVESGGVGLGSEFIVRLPLVTPSPVEVPAPVPASGRPRSVVVVEDNPNVSAALQVALELAGHSVHVFADGPSTLAAVSTLKPDVLLIDIGLPGMDGYKLAAKLKEHPNTKDALSIAVSGFKQRDDVGAEFAHYLSKPIDVPVLLALLDQLG
ncbi:MAG TPA: PAS domain S-box protein [Vicinamibacterales bacterium]|nr:PAS domain S-box protein [Vicinamibacterales bacterium]